MSACPNKNTEEWKRLVNIYGEELALTLFSLNNDVTPTLEEAKRIHVEIQERDEQHVSSTDQFKLDRMKQQILNLNKALIFNKRDPQNAQRKTLEKLINNLNQYILFLEENIKRRKEGKPLLKSTSVSKFIGGTDFSGDAKAYEAFKFFGTFMHDVLEKAQLKTLDTNSSITNVMTEDFFEELYNDFTSKNPFELQNMGKDEMFEYAREIAQIINSKVRAGYIVLPEVTITGKSRTGSLVIGRLDLVLVDPLGKIHILDFKTKKLKKSATKIGGHTVIDSLQAKMEMATNQYPIGNKQEDTAPEFMKVRNRSTFNIWNLQLSMYENMLLQNGFEVDRKSIISLLYQVDETDMKNVLAADIVIFEDDNFYDSAAELIPDKDGALRSLHKKFKSSTEPFKKAVRIEIPVEGDPLGDNNSGKLEKIEDAFEFTPEKLKFKRFITELDSYIQGKKEDILRKRQAALDTKDSKRDPALIEALSQELRSLKFLEAIVDKEKKSESSDLRKSVHFFSTVSQLEENLQKSVESFSELYKKFKESDKDLKSFSLKAAIEIYHNTQSYLPMVSLMREIVNDASENPDNKIDENSAIMKKLGSFEAMAQSITTGFREMSLESIIEIMLRGTNKKASELINKDLSEALSPEIEYLERQIEKLKNSEQIGVFKKFKNYMFSLVDKEYKKELLETLKPDGKAVIAQIQLLEKELNKKKLLSKGFNLDREELEKYAEGITDPNALVYIGATNLWSNLGSTMGMMYDKVIASSSNSDLAVASFVIAHKNQEAYARKNFMNDPRILKLEKIRKELEKKGRNYEELLDKIQEWRPVRYIDENGEVQITEELRLVEPFSPEFEKMIDEESITSRKLQKEIRDLKSGYFDKYKIDKPSSEDKRTMEQRIKEKEEAFEKFKNKEKEYLNFVRGMMEWKIKNANLLFVSDFYKLQLALPDDIRDQLQELYLEQEALSYYSDLRKEDVSLLDEKDFDRFNELDIEIKKLREQAKKINPEYADYIDQFSNLYEYDINEKYFDMLNKNAKLRFADSPETYEKWLHDHQIERPKKEWYDKLAALYEKRAELFEQDSEISELIKERYSILRPYKTAGRLNPKYITQEDYEALERLEYDIEKRIEFLKSDPTNALSKETKRLVAEISSEISSLAEKTTNPEYERLFNSEYSYLKNLHSEVLQAEIDLDLAKTEGNLKKIEETEKLYDRLSDQFNKKEEEFKIWYDNNHYNKYAIGSIENGVDVTTSLHKGFHSITVPVASLRDEYMEKVANPKYYKIKRLRISNWTLDGQVLTNKEIKEIQGDPEKEKELEDSGRLEKLGPGAYNPDFIKSSSGKLLPKEVKKDADGHFYVDPGTATINMNIKYLELMKDKEAFELYKALLDLHHGLQVEFEGKKLGNKVPGLEATVVQTMKKDGLVNMFKKRWEITKDKHLYGITSQESETDKISSAFGELGTQLRSRFTHQLSRKLQSEDSINAILQFAAEAHANIAMQDIAPLSEASLEFLKMQRGELERKVSSGQAVVTVNEGTSTKRVSIDTRLKELNSVIDILEREQQKFLMGQYDVDTNVAIKKALSGLLSYTALVRIGFDAANQTKNLVSGNVQAFIAASVASGNAKYTMKNYLWAKNRLISKFYPAYTKDWGSVSDLSYDTYLYRLYNPLQKDAAKYVKNISAGKSRRLAEKAASVKDLGFLLQDKGDSEIGITTMYAVMDAHVYNVIDIDPVKKEKIKKLNPDGTEMTVKAHEAYYIASDGTFQIRPDVDFTQEDEDFIRNIVYSEIKRAQGNYAKADETYAERSASGKLLLFFRKFLIPLAVNRFGSIRPNYEGAEVAAGYWRMVAYVAKNINLKTAVKELLIGSDLLEKMGLQGVRTYTVVNDKGEKEVRSRGNFHVRKIAQARRDMIAMTLLYILSMAALAYVKRKDEDDEELGMIEGNAIRVLWGVKGEALSMFPIGEGSTEYVKNFTTGIPLVREATTAIKTMSHFSSFLYLFMNGIQEEPGEYDSYFAQKAWKNAYYMRDSGAYQKGDLKLLKDFHDLTPYYKNMRDLFNPSNRIDILKKHI